ncbi:MAG: flagellar export chaperone FliS [Phycisphaerae bacterium]|nr:flagellar export chaperone FliS [Phycisphaerae bacterium]
MTTDTAQTYLRNRVLTARPEELRLMLLDGAIRFARRGRDGLARKDFEAVFAGFSRCREILFELISSMKPEHDPELCARLSGLYAFMISELVDASHSKDATKADKVIELLEYDRETWRLLVEKAASERQPETPLPEPSTAAEAPSSYRPLSLQG